MTGILKEEEIWVHKKTRGMDAQREEPVRTEKMAVCKPRRKSSGETELN